MTRVLQRLCSIVLLAAATTACDAGPFGGREDDLVLHAPTQTLTIGEELSVLATDRSGNVLSDTVDLRWAVSHPRVARAGVIIYANGVAPHGSVFGVAPGRFILEAAYGKRRGYLSFEVLAPPLPSTPTLSGAAYRTGAALEWTSRNPPRTRHPLERRVGEGGAWTLISDGAGGEGPEYHGRYEDHLARRGQTNYYRVRGCNWTGCSPYSNVVPIALQ